MRLIDADEFKKYAHKNLDICAEDLIDMIDVQPTAYNIGKVVEQLENASCYIEDGNGHTGHLVFTDEAIEIVKGSMK